MDKLPAEILCGIFRDTLPEWNGWDRGDVPFAASVSTPLYISHVCCFWRRIALSCGDLWAHLCINYGEVNRWDTHPTKRKIAKEIFDTWLSRTNGSRLSYLFRCEINGDDDQELHEISRHIIRTLLVERHRWKAMHLSWSESYFSPVSGRVLLSDMPMLTSLTLVIWGHKRTAPLEIDLSRSPALRRLVLFGGYNLVTGDKTLQSLTEPSMLNFSVSIAGDRSQKSWSNLLRDAPNLTELHVEFYDPRSLAPSPSESPIVSGLRLLKLRETADSILRCLRLPHLEALHHRGVDVYTAPDVLLSFIRRSLPPLTYLDLGHYDVNRYHLIPILRLLPLLRDLRVWLVGPATLFLRELTVSGVVDGGNLHAGEHIICRDLVSLRISRGRDVGDPEANVDTDTLITMARSRFTVLGTFKRVKFWHEYAAAGECDMSDIDAHIANIRHSFKYATVTFTHDRVPPVPFAVFHQRLSY